jgi:ribosomal-protein-alanine N-acetyltransferase
MLEVRESNVSARSLYEKMGFDEVGVRKNYYSNPRENAILMNLSIDILKF